MTGTAGWASKTVAAVVDAFAYVRDAAFAVSAVDGDDIVARTVPDDPTADRFEVGSIAKTFTATVIAVAVGDGLVGLDDPIGRWLDAGPNADVTVIELATHTSGLPRLAPNHVEAEYDRADPYRHYSPAIAEEGLRTAVRSDRGAVEYSNFGFQLLGMIAERAFDLPFDELVARELFEPIGMVDTAVTGTRPGRSAVGTGVDGAPVSAWHMPLPSAGGFESTAADMARFARAVLAPPTERLAAAIDLVTTERAGTGHGLAWRRSENVVSHGGGTGGFRSMLTIDLDVRRAAFGVVASSGLVPMAAVIDAVVAGRDPSHPARLPADDRHHAVACEAATRLATRDLDGFRALGTEGFAEWFPDEEAVPFWDQCFGSCGAFRTVEVIRADRLGSDHSVIVRLEFEEDGGPIELYLDDDGRLIGFQLLG